MIFRVYGFLLYIFALVYFPVMAVRLALKGRGRAGMKERFGLLDAGLLSSPDGKRVWVHAVSVGETLAAVPLVVALKERRPGLQIFFSTVTETGNAVARENLGGVASRIFYFPFDFGFAVRKVVSAVRPDIFVVVETEIWPNLIKTLHDRDVPAVMVNGRISPRSYRGYSRARFFFSRVLELMSRLDMQTAGDAERIKALGAPEDRVRVAGNIKFDQACKALKEGKGMGRADLGIPEEALVFIAGSTHQGEDEQVLTAFRALLREYPSAVMILAPRHPERLGAVEALVKAGGFRYTLRSRLPGEQAPCPGVILVDTMGELAGMYADGDIIFVGGSLAPVGGHNILEPAAFGKPVFFGPRMHNFAEIAKIMKESGAGMEVQNGEGLAAEAIKLLRDPEKYKRLGSIAKDTLLKNRGALDRNLELVERSLFP